MASLDFERPLRDLHRRIAALRAVALAGTRDDVGLAAEIERLEARAQQLQRDLFDELGAWDKVQLSRHPERPYTLDYIARLVEGFVALHGDRLILRALDGGTNFNLEFQAAGAATPTVVQSGLFWSFYRLNAN